MPEIKIENVNKTFGKNQVLQNVAFTVEHGKCFAIVGTNGKGKTTLLNLLAGLHNPDKGKIHFGGIDLQKKKSAIQKISAYVPESVELVETLTVKQNLFLLAKLKGLKIDGKLFVDLLQQLQLETLVNEKAKSLSLGARYKVALARALLCKPQYLLLDEPNSAIDNDTLFTVKKILKNTKLEQKTTIIVVSHQLTFLENLADEMIFLHNKVIANLSASELYGLAKRPLLEISCTPINEEQIKKLSDIDPDLQVNQRRDLIRLTLTENKNDHNEFINSLISLGFKIKGFKEVPIEPEQLYKKIIKNDITH